MKTAAVFLIITCLMLNLNAQKNISGEYYLQGVMETASGFKLNADSTFEFFFSYGALDRYGSGKWSVNNNTVILNSKPSPGQDFKLASSVASNNKFSTIKLEDKNTNLYRFVYCRVKKANEDSIFSFDNDGSLVLPYAADSIELLSELCPERSSVFAMDKSPMTYTFNFQPWILEVFFNQTAFHFTDNYLEGRHPLLDDKIYRFEKEKASTPKGSYETSNLFLQHDDREKLPFSCKVFSYHIRHAFCINWFFFGHDANKLYVKK